MDDVKAICKRCMNSVPLNQLKLDPDYGKVVCLQCIKAKGIRKEVNQPVKPLQSNQEMKSTLGAVKDSLSPKSGTGLVIGRKAPVNSAASQKPAQTESKSFMSGVKDQIKGVLKPSATQQKAQPAPEVREEAEVDDENDPFSLDGKGEEKNPDKKDYVCKGCKYRFKINTRLETPRNCPYCNRPVFFTFS